MSPMSIDPASPPPDEGRPPLFKTWRGMYALVLGTLAALIALFSLWSWIYR